MLTLAACVLILFVLTLVLALSRCDADLWLSFLEKFGSKPETFFRNKVVWISGATSGIGEALALQLATMNTRLVISGRRLGELERVKQTCKDLNPSLTDNDILTVALDLTQFASHEQAVERVLKHFQKIDVLINNAGQSQRAGWLETSSDVDMECFKVNAAGPVSLTRLVLKRMIANGGGGWIGVVSSAAGLYGVMRSNSYCAAKHALNGFFRTLDIEHRQDKIVVSIICPGLVYSPNNPQNAFTASIDKVHGETYSKTWFHMSAERCALLILVSIANGIPESLVAHPLGLLITRLMLYCPGLAKWFATNLGGQSLLQKLREGKL